MCLGIYKLWTKTKDSKKRQNSSEGPHIIELTRSGSIENSADALKNCHEKLKSDFQDRDGIKKE
jgi:hypothetical protein